MELVYVLNMKEYVMQNLKLKSNIPSLFFVMLLMVCAVLVVYFDNVYQKLIFSLLLGMLLVGALEAVHQATHDNLFKFRGINSLVGTVLANILLLNFIRYRYFHAYHHAYAGTSKDPERSLYLNGGGNGLLALILAPFFYLGFAVTVLRSNSEKDNLHNKARFYTLMLVCFVAGVVGLTVWQPYEMLFVYWLPLVLFAWFDFLLNQAEHYGAPEISEDDDAGQVSNDLLLPKPLAIMFLYRNFHRVHHLVPQTAWYLSAEGYRQQDSKGLRFKDFLRRYFSEGPRLWGVR
jgi:fatty acid desaturase